jgi:hypothetical protein
VGTGVAFEESVGVAVQVYTLNGSTSIYPNYFGPIKRGASMLIVSELGTYAQNLSVASING